MHYPEFHYRWEWQIQATTQALWPLASDTNRFNHDTGLPVLRYPADANSSSVNGRRGLGFSRLGVPIEWEEEPFEWIRPHRFGVLRRYSAGPVAEIRVLADLTPTGDQGTHLVYQVWARPASILGLLAIPFQIGFLSARGFDSAFRNYGQLAEEDPPALIQKSRVHFAPGGRSRLNSLAAALLQSSVDPDLLSKLVELIEEADVMTLARLRPYALADYWGVGRRAMLELCLLTTRAGILELQWELLCPLCRGDKQVSPTLSAVQSQVHCDSCLIDFVVNFDRSVELTFRPNPSIRKVERRKFCIGGPQVTPHIVVQQLLLPARAAN